jgi:uncharacterized protein YbaA (DUF1428 family)
MTVFLAAAGTMLAAPLPAQQAAAPAAKSDPADDIMKKAVNKPGTNWSVYGATQTTKALKDDGVPGGEVLRVTVSAKGANPWDVGGASPIQKPITAGDTILVAVYLRAPRLKDGETASIPFLGAGGATAPYEPVVSTGVTITKDWKLYYASGRAAKDVPGGTANAAIHLAADKQVIDLGPVFVLDFGQNYDPAKLPKN